MSSFRSFVWNIVQQITLALAIFLITYLFLLQPHQVKGQSMEPTFHDNEYLLTDKLSYKIASPKRGDVVIFAAPPLRREDYIKRIVGVPGDTISISGNTIYINGDPLKEPYLPGDTPTYPGIFLPENAPKTLGSDEYFVMGDNRTHSQDSRAFGFIKREDIVGRAWIVYWPVTSMRILPHISFAGM